MVQKNIKDLSQQLLQKKMTRKQFIGHVAVGMLTITGISAALNTMTAGSNKKQKQASSSPKDGYGSSAYGA